MSPKNPRRVGLVIDIHHHRNGSAGNGFWTILFEGAKGSDLEGRSFVATYFDDEDEINTAVLDLAPLIRGEANHCMRGDTFHDELKALADNFDWSKPRPIAAAPPNRRAAIAHTKAKVS
jgi:hypothetical protein